MEDRYYTPIKEYLEENGASGVNPIARAIDLPLSSVQRYLERQHYFIKNERRQWDLPDNVSADIKANTLSLSAQSIETTVEIAKGQLEDLLLTLENLQQPINIVKKGAKAFKQPVAAKSVEIHPSLQKVAESIRQTELVFSKFIPVCPEEYQELLTNLDMGRLMVAEGANYVEKYFSGAITSLFMEQTDHIPDNVLQVIKTYQKGENE